MSINSKIKNGAIDINIYIYIYQYNTIDQNIIYYIRI